MKRIKKYMVICICIVLCMSSFFVFGKNDDRSKEFRVLLISAYSPSFETFFNQVEGIKSGFKDKNVRLDIEFMDTKRFYTSNNLNNFYETIKYKIENSDAYDAIIVADDNALHFVLDYQNELFKEIPIVFMAINDIEFGLEAGENDYVTGILEKASIYETIKIAQKINSNARRVVALTDSTNTGKGILASYYLEADRFDDLVFDDIDLTDYDFATYIEELKGLNSDDIVLMLSVFEDKYNERVSFAEGIDISNQNCSQPIYYLYEHGLGEGLLGGKVVSFQEQGNIAANMVLDIFNGKDRHTIEVIKESPNVYMFDYQVMQEYHIKENMLPPDAVLINKELSFVEKYLSYLIGISALFLLQMTIILVLILNIKKRKEYEIDLLESQEETNEANEELTAMNEELTAINEEVSVAFENIKEKDEKIHDLIYVDSLTGINNRFAIFGLIDQYIIENKDNRKMAVMFIDIDNFKNINDTYGHDVGNQVLGAIASRLKTLMRMGMHVGRFGGDEYIVFISDLKQITSMKKFTNELHELFEEVIMINSRKIFVTASLGISIYPKHAKDKIGLVKKADLALYKAKSSGKNRHVFYNDNMNRSIKKKMALQLAIREAIENDEFFLHYQPYVDVKTHEVSGFEALIRWVSSEYGYVSPYELITNAEEMGVIIEIGAWVFEKACEFSVEVNKGRDKPLKVSINISAVQLEYSEFYKEVVEIVDRTGVLPSNICVEVTETILIESLEKGVNTIDKLKELGFEIALDDFGTGYSSLKYFKGLPVNILKIDKSFIDHITEKGYDKNIIDTIIELAHYKDVKVIAEGVEHKEQLLLLNESGCDTIQGYFFCKPLCKEDVIEFIEKEQQNKKMKDE